MGKLSNNGHFIAEYVKTSKTNVLRYEKDSLLFRNEYTAVSTLINMKESSPVL